MSIAIDSEARDIVYLGVYGGVIGHSVRSI